MKKNPPQFNMKVDPEFMGTLDELRRALPDLPSRSEAVRLAVAKMLKDVRKGAAKDTRTGEANG